MKKFTTISIIVLLVAGMIFLLINNRRKIRKEASSISAENVITVQTDTVKESTYNLSCTSTGIIQPGTDLNFVSDVSGRVVRIYVDKGSRVSRGSVLLKTDSELLESDYQAALAAYQALKKDEERFSRSNEAGGVSDQQLDNIRTQLTAAKSRLDVSRRRLGDATVKSPMDGVINMRYVEQGSLIAPNAPLFEIVNDKTLKIICNLPENKVAELKSGDKVVAVSTDAPDVRFSGRISNIAVKADAGLNYPVEVTMDKNPALRIGMYMKVYFDMDVNHTGILISRNAIVGSAKSANVFVVDSGKALQREVTLGEMVGDSVVILSGLNNGDALITSGIMNVSDGDKVKTIK
jgi:RND family efflux transporter MFP subunit